MKRNNRKGRIILAVLFVIGALLLVRVSGPERERLSFPERLVQDICAPFQSGLTALFDWADNLPLYFGGVKQIIAENEALKQELVGLQEEIAQLSSAYKENVRLKDLLKTADEMSEWKPVSAKVIAREDSSWYKSITISGGENKGFKKDMAVITAGGLIGRLTSVSGYTSEVLLLLDNNCAVSAIIQESNTYGVVEAMEDNYSVLQMKHIPYDTYAEEGQVIISSGLGGIFPAGLRIGYISEISSDSGGLMQKASIVPYADFERLTEVLVLTRSEEEVAK